MAPVDPFTEAMSKVQTAFSKQVNDAEKYVGVAVRDVHVGNIKWSLLMRLAALLYAGLAVFAAFAREDFLNVSLARTISRSWPYPPCCATWPG